MKFEDFLPGDTDGTPWLAHDWLAWFGIVFTIGAVGFSILAWFNV